MNPHLSVVIPVHNEAEFILPFYYDLIKHVPADFELVWVNDSSSDTTLSEIEHLSLKDERIKCITLRKQFGKEAAVFAGLDYASGEHIIVMSGDLQHPSRLIPAIDELLSKGVDIVNTNYNNAAKIFPVFKKILDPYYRFLNRLNRSKTIDAITDFRGFRREVIDDIRFIKEKQFFSGHFFNWGDYKMDELLYENNRCSKNKRRYTIQHLLRSTIDTFSNNTPGIMKMTALTGGLLCLAAITVSLMLLIKYFSSNQLHALPFVLTAVLFAGGLQMLIFSNYRRKLKKDLHMICRNHQYLIKSILEPEDEYLSNYNFPRKETIQL